jgi:transposase-like protein
MNIPSDMPRLKGFRFPREIIAYAVWAYHRFALSNADVEDLLAERGVIVSREAIRLWVNRFGRHFADCIKRDRPTAADKWHLDEVVIPINGEKQWLWRAVDSNGDTLDILVQTRRNAKAAKRFLARLIAQFGQPRVVITPSRDIPAECTAGQWTSYAATSSRSHVRHPVLITGPTRASTTGSRAATGRRGDERKSWGGSNRPGRRSGFSPPMTRSTPSSIPVAIASTPTPIVMQGLMRSAFGPTMPAR